MSNIQKPPPSPSTQIDDVLERIQANEQAKGRKNQVVLIFVALILIGATIGIFALIQRPSEELEVYGFRNLDTHTVQVALQNEQQAILVRHPDLGTDTIRSVEDFANLVRIAEALARLDELENQVSQDTLEALGLPEFSLDIAGQRMAGELLTFTVENYDPEVEYLLDFGNGYRRTIKARTSYRYPRPGRFELRLLASKDSANSLYEKRFRIIPANAAPSPSQPQTPLRVAQQQPSASSRIEAMQEPDPDLFAANDATPIESLPQSNEEVSQPPPVEEPSPEDLAPTREPLGTTSQEASNKVFMTSDLPPSFPGGQSGLSRFIRRNFRYTDEAVKAKADGAVILRFIVNTDGSLSNISVVRGIGYGLDEEAIRLVNSMPNWNPGELAGQKVRVYHTMPITVRLLN